MHLETLRSTGEDLTGFRTHRGQPTGSRRGWERGRYCRVEREVLETSRSDPRSELEDHLEEAIQQRRNLPVFFVV
jgi:hypothetical protein